MPKPRTTPAENTPQDHLDAGDDAAPKPPRKKLRPAANVATYGHFGAAARGATHWGVRRYRPDGTLERVGGPSPDGTMLVHEWPLEELDDSLATRLGPGKYKLEWIGAGPTGARTHLKWGREFEVPASRPAPIANATSSPAPAQPAASLDALDALRSVRALVREERELVDQGVSQQLSALAQLAAVMRPTAPAAPALPPELTQALTAIGGVLQRLEARVDALEGGDDDDDDDDEDEDEDEAGANAKGEIFKPSGEGHGDVAVAAGLNKIASFLDAVSPAGGELAAEWLSEKAEEMRRKRAAREHHPALNGRSPVPTSSPETEVTTDAVG